MGSTNYDFTEEIIRHLEESIELKQLMVNTHIDKINKLTNTIIQAYKNNKKVFWMGNGGSAADAQHLSCELVSKFSIDRIALPSIALTTNTSTLTAVSNDYSFDKVFSRQIEGLAQKGDIVIGLTTSGTSPNVIKGLEAGKKKGATTIAFTGEEINAIDTVTDIIIDVPSNDTPRIQEIHITIGHIVCYLVEQSLFGEKTWGKKQSLLTETVQ